MYCIIRYLGRAMLYFDCRCQTPKYSRYILFRQISSSTVGLLLHLIKIGTYFYAVLISIVKAVTNYLAFGFFIFAFTTNIGVRLIQWNYKERDKMHKCGGFIQRGPR